MTMHRERKHRHLSNAGKNQMEGGALPIVSQMELEFRNNRARPVCCIVRKK
jgi:hypothetical protein